MRPRHRKQDRDRTKQVAPHLKENVMNVTHNHRWQAAAVAALVLTAVSTAPASAGTLHDPSVTAQTASAIGTTNHTCWLLRVGTQLVRCDNLTGNGVQAPAVDARTVTANDVTNQHRQCTAEADCETLPLRRPVNVRERACT